MKVPHEKFNHVKVVYRIETDHAMRDSRNRSLADSLSNLLSYRWNIYMARETVYL